MQLPYRRFPPVLLLGLALSSLKAEIPDPVGYVTLQFVAGEKGSMAVSLSNFYKFIWSTSAAGTDYVEFNTDLPPDLLGVAQSAWVDVRSGPGAGQSFRVTGVSGRRVSFEAAPLLLPITTGTTVGIRPDWSLGELIGSPPRGSIQQGASHESADVLGVQDPATQTTREFFYESNGGWREIGKEAEGECSATAVPFRSSLQFLRRGETNIAIVLLGAVPMYSAPHHWVRVWPGRNLLTTPFSPAKTIQHLFDTSSLNSGASAPRSDTFRLVYADASVSKLIYLHQGLGWTTVTRVEEEYDDSGNLIVVEDTPVDLSVAMDFQRNGAEGYLKFNTSFSDSGAFRALAVAEEVVPVEPALSDLPARKIAWASRAGTTYQVQTRALGSVVWSDYGSPVFATGDVCQKICTPDGSGIFRIVVR